MRSSGSVKPSRTVLCLGLVVAVMASSANAAGGDSYRLRYNVVDQTAARETTLRNSDLPRSSRWNGWQQRATSATLGPFTCPTLRPRVSDLVVTGAADSWWERGPGFPDGPSLSARSRVFATARMASLDVRRSWPSGAVGCLRQTLSMQPQTSPCAPTSTCTTAERIVRFQRIAFPRLASFTLAIRFVTQYKLVEGGTRTGTVRVTSYVVVLQEGRTEIVLNAFGGHGRVTQSSVARLARILIGRI